MNLVTICLLIHLAATWALAGLIWVVQIVIYPQFPRVWPATFQAYHFAHCFRIGLIVAPLILLEAATAAWLLYQGQGGGLFFASLWLLALVWMSTLFVQAPIHTRLMKGLDERLVRLLIWTNWARTLAWTGRGVLVTWVVAGLLLKS